jgi:hypothetical protein
MDESENDEYWWLLTGEEDGAVVILRHRWESEKLLMICWYGRRSRDGGKLCRGFPVLRPRAIPRGM